jgi:uracil-DNA glycosylase
MFVGEGPGAEEDKRGLPFVGRSGQLIDRLIEEELGMTRPQTFFANVVKCLRGDTNVQLEDGSWERIGELVRRRYDGGVMCVNERGELVGRPVIDWHASPLAGRRTFRMTFRTAKAAGVGKVSTVLTGDHEVMSENGWVRADALVSGQLVATGHGLTDVELDVACGTVLGDGHLHRKGSHLSFTHSEDQFDYAIFKAHLLGRLGTSVADRMVSAVAGGPSAYRTVAVRTSAHRALRTLAAEFYTPAKVVPPWMSERLTPRMVAIWFMDGGYLRTRPNRRPSAEIATCGLDDRALTILVAGLERLGVAATARRGRLQLNVTETAALCELIAPFVPPAMRYKLHPEVALSTPYDSAAWRAAGARVMFDAVEIDEIPADSDQTYFCIDVEEAHNFVTAGGVVHNCRPPGNRDPQPIEIDTCRPFLEQQIDIIRPKVIVTLGNFSTKLLLNTAEGITKLRGRAYPYAHGVIIPTFHPAAALRGGGAVLAHMRADLVRAKLALAGSDA